MAAAPPPTFTGAPPSAAAPAAAQVGSGAWGPQVAAPGGQPPPAAAPSAPQPSWGRRLRRFGYRYCGTMFLEDTVRGKSLSFGRTSAIGLLGLCMWHWAHGSDVPPGCLQTLTALLGYNLATKGVVLGQTYLANRAAPAAEPASADAGPS